MTDEIAYIWPLLAKQNLPYPPQAYGLVQRGLKQAVVYSFDENDLTRLHGQRHVRGQELCIGIRDVAVQRYGSLARTVLHSWNVHATNDFGRMVYAMVEAGLLRTNDGDTIDDFDSVYEFDEEFCVEVTAEA